MLVRSVGGEFRLSSRSGLDLTAEFPELRGIVQELGLLDVVLDGEVVAIDPSGRTNFHHSGLARYDRRTVPAAVAAVRHSVPERQTTSRCALVTASATARRTRAAVREIALHGGARTTGRFGRRRRRPGREHNYEVLSPELRTSVYQQGRRSTQWRKHKNWNDIEVVIGGWRPGNGNRADTIGSLLLGLPEEPVCDMWGAWAPASPDAQLRSLADELEPLRIRMCPFIDALDRPVASTATWVLPKLVGECGSWTGRRRGILRHPSWRGIRRDKLPGDL